MLNTACAFGGMVTAPHHLAASAGLNILREGGTALEAAVAMAATLSVVYPHMTGIGGDGFWLVAPSRGPQVGIDASGPAARAATSELYVRAGLSAIPARGPLAANTVAGAMAGWTEALALARALGGRLPLARLLEEAIWHAEHGFAVTRSQAEATSEKCGELATQPGFSETFLTMNRPPRRGARMALPALGGTLRRLCAEGIDSFYRGALARSIAADLSVLGAPVTEEDLACHKARRVAPLRLQLKDGTSVGNLPPPTQGLASLMILGLFDRLDVNEPEGFAFVHGLVEATKQAFLVRDRIVGDPSVMTQRSEDYLRCEALDAVARRIDRSRALPWSAPPGGGDTVWFGAADSAGTVVSAIQSIYFEFGSGCVLPETGIVWQNRGTSFSLNPGTLRSLAPGRKPFHTLNPALAAFPDGRMMAYGTMGGDGQPQTQAAIFARYARFGLGLQEAVSAPRWLLGRTWGERSVTLKLESRFDGDLFERLAAAGHALERVAPFTSLMGHAGAIVRCPDGLLEGACDPRSDGAVMGY